MVSPRGSSLAEGRSGDGAPFSLRLPVDQRGRAPDSAAHANRTSRSGRCPRSLRLRPRARSVPAPPLPGVGDGFPVQLRPPQVRGRREARLRALPLRARGVLSASVIVVPRRLLLPARVARVEDQGAQVVVRIDQPLLRILAGSRFHPTNGCGCVQRFWGSGSRSSRLGRRSRTRNSTRRLVSRPARVAFVASGREGPKPRAASRERSMPWAIR